MKDQKEWQKADGNEQMANGFLAMLPPGGAE
jgi:hypothetical protein